MLEEENIVKLPIEFTKKMEKLLGSDFDNYMKSYEESNYVGIRINTLKISPEEFEKISPFELQRIPWTTNGYYVQGDAQPAKHPYYYAGLYYIQEPSAMTPAAALPVEEGDYVLDMCAAPGGKSTELAAKLKGTGVLVSNDISSTRARALVKNLSLFGAKNALVTCENPGKLSNYFPEYFDKILVDAPCSGEGMFRKDPSLIKSWEELGVEHFVTIQKEIILEAAKMLKPGGIMVYSTCTFSPEENEGAIMHLLEHFKEFRILDMNLYDGFDHGHPEWVENGTSDLNKCVRIWPHKVAGEGHFVALLQKGEPQPEKKKVKKMDTIKISEEATEFLKQITDKRYRKNLQMVGESLFSLPDGLGKLDGLYVLRSGVYLGDIKKNRFEPGQALALVLSKDEFPCCIDLNVEDERVIRYLKGETIEVEDTKGKGYHLVCVDGYPLGFGKLSKGTLKNKYLPGWRWL